MKALKNIATGFYHSWISVMCLLDSVILFVEIFYSQSFMAILYFILSLIFLAISLLCTYIIGMYINKEDGR